MDLAGIHENEERILPERGMGMEMRSILNGGKGSGKYPLLNLRPVEILITEQMDNSDLLKFR
jgi:hypothetical protein